MSTTKGPAPDTRISIEETIGSSELTVALVGCGKAKVTTKAAAENLYIGIPFRLAMRHARETADDVHILSALHGLLAPHAVIPPYDFSMAQMPPHKHLEWGQTVLRSLRMAYPMQRIKVVFYAGKQYVRPIMKAITDEDCYWSFEDPLAGLDLFERIKWFKNNESRPF